MILIRPADANEVVGAWRAVMGLTDRPARLVLSRRALPTLDRSACATAAGVVRGAYVLADTDRGMPDVLLLASGSEVALCVAAHEQLKGEGIAARVVSMPPWDLFESAPGKVAQAHFGFDVANVVAAARQQVALHSTALPGRDKGRESST